MYQVKIKVVKLEFFKGIVQGSSNSFWGQFSAPAFNSKLLVQVQRKSQCNLTK